MRLIDFLQDYRFDNVNKIVYDDKVFIYNKNKDAYLCSYDGTDLFAHVNSNEDMYKNVLILDNIVESDDYHYTYLEVKSLKKEYAEREKSFYDYMKKCIEDLRKVAPKCSSQHFEFNTNYDVIRFLESMLREYECTVYKNNGSV